MIQIERIIAGVYAVNCYVVYDDETNEGYVIDPSGSEDKIINFLVDKKIDLKGILLTHAHGDHHMGLAGLKAVYPVPVYLHASDVYMAKDAAINLSNTMYGPDSEFTPEVQLQDGMKLQLGNTIIRTIHTPGHTKGGVCYLVENYLFSGDTLFESSIVRTDLDGGNHDQLIKAIKTQLLKLADDVIVLPGHGGSSTIGRERARNPYLVY
jgi:glyoxylase-like metal-dependent hydrolase (beta-lactamase superfamily II)